MQFFAETSGKIPGRIPAEIFDVFQAAGCLTLPPP